jgi:hypothetical protein
LRQQLDEVQTAVFKAPMDVLGGDVVAAASDSMLHSFDVQLRTGKANVPDINLDAVGRGLREEARNRVGAERSLKSEVFTFREPAVTILRLCAMRRCWRPLESAPD